MFPAIKDGDLLILYKLEPYVPEDVIAFKNTNGDFEISRIFAKEGSEVDISYEGEVLLDGHVMAESIFYKTEKAEGSFVTYPCLLRESELFVLDDYRTIGTDSRVFGPIKKDQVIGKVLYVFRKRGI